MNASQNRRKPFKPERPQFPDGYGFTPDTPHSPPTWEWVTEQIKASRNYWICTAAKECKPHAMPVWGVWFDDTLYFVTKRQSKKARNLYDNPQVVVHLESADDLVVLEGIASDLTDSIKLTQVAEAYSAKYTDDQIFPDLEAVFELELHVAFSWLESDFHGTATKWC